MEITLSSNAPTVGRYLGTVAPKQARFAASKTINVIAKGVKAQELKRIRRYFTVRTKWTTKSGALPLKYSSKRQSLIHAQLRVKDEVMSLSATGGEHKAKTEKMAVPFSDAGEGKSARQILNPGKRTLTKGKWPSRLLNKGTGKRGRVRKVPKPFLMINKGHKYVVKRTSKTDDGIQFLYGFKRRVDIDKDWPLIKNVDKYLDARFAVRFKYEFKKALMSAK